MILLDTTVLIDALRDKAEAHTYLASLDDEIVISAITVAELYVGFRPGDEEAISSLLSTFRILPVNDDIARQAGLWRQSYGRSHGVSLTDALIAATADRHGARLVTHNTRHFPMFNLKPPYLRR